MSVNVTTLQASVTKTATFNGAGVPVWALPAYGTVLMKVSALTSGKNAQFQIQSSADGFVSDIKVERQFNFWGPLGAVYPETQTAHDYDMPEIRLGLGAAALAAVGTVSHTPSTSGGTLPAHAYFWVVTATNAAGEGPPSAEVTDTTTGSTSSDALSWSAITGATGYRIYRGGTAGAESVFYTSNTNSYTDTNAASTAGTPPTAATGAALRVVLSYIDASSSVTYEAYLQS